MRARKLMLVAAILVVAVVAARGLGLWVGGQFATSPTTTPTTPTAPPAPLTFAAGDLTFGPIPESEPVERTLRLTNTTAEPITVSQFNTSCSCLGVEPAGNLTLAAGETAALKVRLKASIPPNAKLSADDLFAESVTLTAVHPGGRVQAEFRYTVRQTVRCEPAVVQLGVVSHREPLTAKITLTLRPPVADVRVLPHPEWTVTIKSTGDGTRELSATPTRPGVPRVVNDTLQLVPVGSDGQDRPTRPLPIRGEIQQDVVSSLPDIRLGRVTLGDTAEESFRLRSLTKRPFEVRGVEPDSADVTTTDPTDRHLLVVRVRVRNTGEQRCQLRVEVTQDDGSKLAVLIPIHYHGAEGMR